MILALSRSLWVSISVLVSVALWEVLTFELPREPNSAVWKQRLTIHLILLACIALGSLAGSLLGFFFFPSGRVLKVWRLALLGGMLAFISFFAIGPLAALGGFIAAFIGSLVIAVVVVQIAGRLLAKK